MSEKPSVPSKGKPYIARGMGGSRKQVDYFIVNFPCKAEGCRNDVVAPNGFCKAHGGKKTLKDASLLKDWIRIVEGIQ